MIKLLLLLGLSLMGLYVVRARATAAHLAVRRIGVVAILGLGMLATLFPNRVTEFARMLGVGRGSDLLLYVLAVTFLFVTLSLYRRIWEIESKYIQLARRQAIQQANLLREKDDGVER